MTTPAAAPAAPAAAAPAAPVIPAAAPAAPAPAAAPAVTNSLLPAEPAAAPAAPAAPAPAAPAKTVDPNSPNAWVLTEGVLGTGERPAWFKADKYKSVSEQAAAYPELEKRFGSFVGAPKDGKYEFKAPEGLGVELVNNHPILVDFQKWAAANQLSQEGYQNLVGMLAQYEAEQLPNMGEIKTQLGTNADARITAVAQWGKANLGTEGYAMLREATSGRNAAAVFSVLESVIGKTKQVALPKPGVDTPGSGPTGLAAIKALQAKVGQDGKRLWDTDPKHRVLVEQAYAAHYAATEERSSLNNV